MHELTYLSLISFRQCQPKDEHESINYSEINSRRVDFRLDLWEELSYILDIENIFYFDDIFRNLNVILYCDSIKYTEEKH